MESGAEDRHLTRRSEPPLILGTINVDGYPSAKLGEFHKTVVRKEQGGLPYSSEESSLLDFHYSNLEFACGAELTQVHLALYTRRGLVQCFSDRSLLSTGTTMMPSPSSPVLMPFYPLDIT